MTFEEFWDEARCHLIDRKPHIIAQAAWDARGKVDAEIARKVYVGSRIADQIREAIEKG